MTTRDLFRKADRRQLMADYLMGQVAPIYMQHGQVASQYGIGHGLTDLAQALMAKRANRKADEAYSEAETARQQELAKALGGQFAGAQQAIDSGADPRLVGMQLQSQMPQDPESTDDTIEYAMAKQQGFEGSLADWIQATKSPGTTVNVRGTDPTPAQGYRNVYDEEGRLSRQEAIPGGPAAAKIQEQEEKAEGRQAALERKGDIVLDELRRGFEIMESPSLPEAGAVGKFLSNVPGTDAFSLGQRLATIKANIGFDRLQEMRENSPTGGALGNVTVQEIDRLERVMGALEQAEEDKDLYYNMARLNNIYLDTVHGPGNGPERMSLEQPKAQETPEFSSMSDEELIRWIRDNE